MVGGSRGVPGHHQDGHHSLRPDLDAGRHREQQMFSVWRYVLLISTIIGAIITPSTDPLTQLLLSLAIVILYFSGASILFLIKK